ncbi:MAG: XdhC family protein [Planctomycetota bacterium]|jgi:xanthine dehydrogenase accessory factor
MCQSRPPADVHREVVERIDAGRSFALAVILQAEGSTPQKVGVKAIIDADGVIYGTLGGGLVEAEAQRRAVEACRSERPAVFDFDLADTCAADAGPICGGTMRILIDPTAAKDRAAYAQAADALQRRRPGVLLTRVCTAAQPEVSVEWFSQEAMPAEDDFPGPEAVRASLDRETPRLCVESSRKPGERMEVLVEPVIPKPLLLIAGGGHVGQALARQAVLIGFDVTVVDDRPEFTAAALFPEAVTTRCGDIARQIADFPIAEDTYVVIVTRGHKHDAEALAACLHSPAAYVGMIGSRRKVDLIRKSFVESDLATQEEFDRVFAPIGLDIGAVTVPEIATSIAAELIAVRRNRRRRPDV